MISREQLKLEIDTVNEAHIEILHCIIMALEQPVPPCSPAASAQDMNPLKGSVTFEHDLISPIDVSWNAELGNP